MRNENKHTGNVRTTTEVELKGLKTSKANRNTWVDIYNEATACKAQDGAKIEIDDGLESVSNGGNAGRGRRLPG